MDFQLYDYSENYSTERLQELKNSWTLPAEGIMESSDEYFSWPNDLKLSLGNSKFNAEAGEPIKCSEELKNLRKRKCFAEESGTARKIPAVDVLKDPLELSSEDGIMQKQDKRDLQNGTRIAVWPVDEITDNLTAELNGTLTNLSDFGNGAYNVSDALLSLPNLTVFKQEVPSPTSHDNTALTIKNNIPTNTTTNQPTVTTDTDFPDSNNNQNAISATLQNLLGNNYTGLQSPIDNGGVIDSSSSQDGHRNVVTSSDLSEDCRFQYVLAAATSIATKVNEDTLTYLNQGQSYEIKLKKLGDLSNYRGRILKSVIRVCFYERRLQYMEREQLRVWQSARPGDRIIDVDVPLSYGLTSITQPATHLNAVHFLWDPTKDTGVYIKVNCISTEFTPKKHGGEKGVPFRIQVETYLTGEQTLKRLHAAACQVKVFKLKGADRKHKQDRDKIMKRPLAEQDKYQPSYDCTVLNDIPNEAVEASPLPTVNGVTSTVAGPYSPENVPQSRPTEYLQKIEECAGPLSVPVRCNSSPNLLVPESQPAEVNVQNVTVDSSVEETALWLSANRFTAYSQTFSGFSGADMLRMSRDDLIQICGQADGIRLYNSLHSKSIAPKLTMYVCRENTAVFHALYMTSLASGELSQKLSALIGIPKEQIRNIYCQGPHGIHVLVNDDVLKHIKEESMFSVDITSDANGYVCVLKPIVK